MNACVRCSLRLATIHICMVLTACASPPPPPSWLDFTGSTAPPIVLRMAEGSPRNEALPSPIGQFAGYAGSGVLGALMLALPTFGVSLILVPLGLVEGAKEAGRAGASPLTETDPVLLTGMGPSRAQVLKPRSGETRGW